VVRPLAVAAVLLIWTAACGRPPEPAATPASPEPTRDAGTVNPARIDRVRQELPAGYEVVGLDPRATPVSLWGFGPNWTAEPPECAESAAPVADPARGWSASGPGGIVYTAIAQAKASAGGPDSERDARCGQWRVSGGHAVGSVTAVEAPVIEDAVTVGMATDITTVVEGGTETHSHADTFTADLNSDLGGYHVFVTVVTDPGSPNPTLQSGFAADLLVKTVSALRG
jgi:hypothetical protein